jgi:hypothetical protein
VSDQVQGSGYSEFEVEMNTLGLELETDITASDQVVSLEISNQERYSTE